MVQPVPQAHGVDEGVDPLLVTALAREVHGEGDVLADREGGDQVEGLEDEADALPAQQSEPAVVERAEVGVADEGGTGGEGVESGGAVHQGGLAGTGGPHDRGEAAGREVDAHPVQALTSVSPVP